MEDVLAVYTRPYYPLRPQVCLDETSRQLLGEVISSLLPAPGRPARGCATCSWCASRWLAGARSWSAHGAPGSIGRTASETWSMSTIPTPSRSCWCKTTPSTHTPASLYAAFPPPEARRLADKLELHYTPKHGSWLNMAEIELAVLAEQCLDRRLADQATLQREVVAWQAARNASGRGVDWRFTTEDARIKLKHLYPAIQG
jgi:DDE superfamily endonuclease